VNFDENPFSESHVFLTGANESMPYLPYFVTDLVEIRYENSPRHDVEQVGVLFKMSAVTRASYLVTHFCTFPSDFDKIWRGRCPQK
jgi:hypothetical protein